MAVIEYVEWYQPGARFMRCLACGSTVVQGDLDVHTKWHEELEAVLANRPKQPECPTCGPTTLEQHPRWKEIQRCSNCKEWLK